MKNAILSAISLAGAAMATPVPAQDRFAIAITVDDLPAHGSVPQGADCAAIARAYLATLKAHGVLQAFGFVNAAKVGSDPTSKAVLDIWREAGYPLGNHGYNHLNLNRAATIAAWTDDVVAGEPMVAKHMAGRNWHYYRFPNLAPGTGERQIEAADVLKARGYRVADVSVAFSDWVYTDAYVRCLARGDRASIAAMKVQYLKGVEDGITQMKAVSRRVYGRVIPQVLLTHLGGWSAMTLPDVMARLDAAGATYVTLESAQADTAYAAAEKLPGGGSMMARAAKAKGINLADIAEPKTLIDLKQLCR